MTTLQLNAEIYEALSIIAQDESLLKKSGSLIEAPCLHEKGRDVDE
jgi:hypothetical protein